MGLNSVAGEIPFGNPNGLVLRLVEVTDSRIAQQSGGSTRSLVHLQVAPEVGEVLTVEMLEKHALDTEKWNEIFSLFKARLGAIRREFIPSSYKGPVLTMQGVVVRDGHVYARIAVGEPKPIMDMRYGDWLWTGHPFTPPFK